MRTIRNNRGAVPMWVKILLAVLVVGILGIVAFEILTVSLVTTDPAKVAALAKDAAVISDPLPGSFKWKRGIDMKIMGMVAAEAGDGQVILLSHTSSADKDAQSMMDESSTYVPDNTKMISVDEKGTDTVGGQPMDWELGTIDQNGKRSKGFIGVVVIKPKSKTVFVFGVQPTGTYNLPETKQFLTGIQSF